MPVKIIPYVGHEHFRGAIREIFFLSTSRQHFVDDADRDGFFDRWTSYYLDLEPALTFLALDEDGEVLGYISGCADSAAAQPILAKKIPSFAVFQDQFKRFPVHLHINCHPLARGKGVGTQLVRHLEVASRARGVHLVTSPNAANVGFYRRLGYTFEVVREWKGQPLLFMGHTI